MDPENPKTWGLTGKGRRVDGSQKYMRENPKGTWCLTGKGRRVKEQSDGSQIIHEGTWGPRGSLVKEESLGSNRMGLK